MSKRPVPYAAYQKRGEMIKEREQEIERLTLKVEAYKRYRAENRKLQARVETLESLRYYTCHMLAAGGEEALYHLKKAIAATKQGESDGQE